MSFYSSVLDVAAEKLGEFLLEDGSSVFLVDDEAKSLHVELKMMASFVEDIEDEGHDARTNTVVSEVRKIAYDVEDLIDSYIIEVERSKDSQEEGILKRSVHFFVSKTRTYKLAPRIKAIRKRIEEILKGREKYWGENAERIEGRHQGVKRTRFRPPVTFPHDIEQHVVGLEEDINKLVGILTTDQNPIEMVSIVGMGGSGKTTLARKLYNHGFIKTHFDCIAWVSISQEWDVTEILLDLLAKVSGYTVRIDGARRPELVERLQRYLGRKRYLIILDDVWRKEALEDILPAFPSANRKIIVTTRKKKVTRFLDLKRINHKPKRLSKEESWQLFRKIAFINREESSNPADMTPFEALGKEMLEKCEGLPLAVIALAGILGKKKTIEGWKKIKKAVSSWIMKEGIGTLLYGPVNEMLALSYNDLPCELKPCFLYLANFEEDRKIDVQKLIRMWIAEGFIKYDNLHEGDTLEDLAQEYLYELIHRCVVQVAEKRHDGTVVSIRMHDLVRDLCIKKAKQQDFAEIFTSKATNSNATVTESRRIAVYHHNGVDVRLPKENQALRFLLYTGSAGRANLDLQVICQNFRLLRVLCLEGVDSSDGTLPTGIGKLIHLRYFRLSETNISELPSSIGNLRNLQTLEYYNQCNFKMIFEYSQNGIVSIPDVLWKIGGLRHIDMFVGAKPINDKLKLRTLKSLQTLLGIRGGDWMVEELPLLSQTVQELVIKCIRRQKQLEAAFECPSIKSDRLHKLDLEWDSDVTLKGLEPIVNCQHLRELLLAGRIEGRLGGCDIQFPNCIRELILRRSRFEAEATLAALGKLPNLIILRLFENSYVGTKWICFAGDFPQLEKLQVDDFPSLEEWSIERGAMSQLSSLLVKLCPNLRKLPEGLKFITGLQLLSLNRMSDEFDRRLNGEDAHIIQHVPTVRHHPINPF